MVQYKTITVTAIFVIDKTFKRQILKSSDIMYPHNLFSILQLKTAGCSAAKSQGFCVRITHLHLDLWESPLIFEILTKSHALVSSKLGSAVNPSF